MRRLSFHFVAFGPRNNKCALSSRVGAISLIGAYGGDSIPEQEFNSFCFDYQFFPVLPARRDFAGKSPIVDE
jgi:hypothetical protein